MHTGAKGSLNHSGMTLLSAVMSMAIVSVLLVVMNQMFANVFRAKKKLDNGQEIAAIRQMILENTSCAMTLTPALPTKCDGSPLKLRGRKNRLLVGDDIASSKLGAFNLKAVCEDVPVGDRIVRELNVYASRLAEAGTLTSTENSSFRADPLTGRPMSWKAILPKGAGLCQAYFDGKEVDFCPKPGIVRELDVNPRGCHGNETQLGLEPTTRRVCCAEARVKFLVEHKAPDSITISLNGENVLSGTAGGLGNRNWHSGCFFGQLHSDGNKRGGLDWFITENCLASAQRFCESYTRAKGKPFQYAIGSIPEAMPDEGKMTILCAGPLWPLN